MKSILCSLFFLIGCSTVFSVEADVVIANFDKDYGTWTVEGEAFGKEPAHGPFAQQRRLTGIIGNGFANSGVNGDQQVGRLISSEFTIERGYIQFLIAGASKGVSLNLKIDGKTTLKAAPDRKGNHLRYQNWDVKSFMGRKAQIEIEDQSKSPGGYILVDEITQTNFPLQKASQAIQIEKPYLLIPVKNGAPHF
ncbi:MAG: hypothetical protein V4507_00140, partial [Verrucomicrobiota bacterium]